VKKIKKFISLACKHLAILRDKKIPDFRIKPASLCKGWGGNVIPAKAGIQKTWIPGQARDDRGKRTKARRRKPPEL